VSKLLFFPLVDRVCAPGHHHDVPHVNENRQCFLAVIEPEPEMTIIGIRVDSVEGVERNNYDLDDEDSPANAFAFRIELIYPLKASAFDLFASLEVQRHCQT